MSAGGEFCRLVKLDRLPLAPLTITATQGECGALAARFGLPAVHDLSAEVSLTPVGTEVDARGTLRASYTQRCAVADEPFTTTLEEPIAIRFVTAEAVPDEDEEIEFASDAPDEIAYDGSALDLGEAIAQSFGLALDPYAEGPDAETVRREVGLLDEDAPSGPFAALANLKLP